MSIWNRVKCAIGLHAWCSEYRGPTESGNAERMRYCCLRCGTVRAGFRVVDTDVIYGADRSQYWLDKMAEQDRRVRLSRTE